MPWNNQGGGGGGGPWGTPPGGGGNQNPWGRGPSGPSGPDLEDLLRRGQERMRGVLPGGIGGGRGIAIIGGVIVALWAASGFYRVQPDEQGVVWRFGEYVRTEPPGLRYHIPAPIETVFRPKVTRVNRVEVGFRSADGRRQGGDRDVADESLMVTGDENIIDIDFSVFWLIKDAGNYLFKIRDPENTVKKAAESAMREIIGRTPIQPALTEKRAEIENDTRELLQRMLDDYHSGVEITQVQLQKTAPPAPVVDAFDDVQRAKADKERLRNEAEAYRNDIIPRARGEAARLLQEAEAYKEQVVDLAQGDAQRFAAVQGAYAQAKETTLRRLYLETMEAVLKGANKIILDGQAGGAVPYLPLNELLHKAPAAASSATVPTAPSAPSVGAR